jgi:hypothetical protein
VLSVMVCPSKSNNGAEVTSAMVYQRRLAAAE